MANFFDKLPTILVLAVLVGIFVALGRHVRSLRLKLWTVAWVLIYFHFFIGIFEPVNADPTGIQAIIDYGFLALSALFFIASLTSFVSDRKLTYNLIALLGIPTLVYTAGQAYDVKSRALYILCLLVIFFGGPLFVLSFRRFTEEAAVWMPVSLVAGVFSLVHAWRRDFDFGFLAMLTAGFAMPGYLYWRRHRRWSPGVITSAGGFLLWGLVFPIGALLDAYAPNLKINGELWNTPKYFVAFGMILTLLEDKSEYLKSASERERKLSRQLQKFAGITSRMLTGAEISSLCQEIASSITETSTFRRVVIILSNETRGLALAGHSGFEPDEVQQLETKCAHAWKLEHVGEICGKAARLGQNSFLVQAPVADQYGPIPSRQQFDSNPYWENGSLIMVPLRSGRGGYVGTVALDDPSDVTSVTAEEMSKIELLAGDLAVTVDNATLHRQLVRSEKLAAIGQLVAGVAHELNNPLASIVGYSELLTDEISTGAPRQKLDKMIREAQRMRRIIENLLRFARQNNLEKKSANLHALLQEVLALREYHIRASKVDVNVHVEADLPHVALDEDQFKQILLNLLNNSIDALEGLGEKQIEIRAIRRDDRVVIWFEDNGPGFTEINRVFDPFYTTKPVGKGTGLGLSICYGIVKEHGGDIQAANRDPGGARITMELPLRAGDRVASDMVAAH